MSGHVAEGPILTVNDEGSEFSTKRRRLLSEAIMQFRYLVESS